MRATKGAARNKAKKRLFRAVEGFVGGRRRLLRTAKETLLRAGMFSLRDRRGQERALPPLFPPPPRAGQEARLPPAVHPPPQRGGRDARPPLQPPDPRPAPGRDRPGSQEPLR